MLCSTPDLLRAARDGGYAVGAFNVYNLEGVRAVVAAAEAAHSPAILQLHPGALDYGGALLVTLCLTAAREARVPVSVHLDHSTTANAIRSALTTGLNSIMADGSHLSYADNVAFTREMAAVAHAHGAAIEAELGRLTGTEDGLTVPEYEAKFTSPAQAVDFVAETGIDALAVCIGNVHGHYRGEPRLDFERLATISQSLSLPLVMHGASGLPEGQIRRAIELGVCKFNVNTEVREAYLATLKADLSSSRLPDLVPVMTHAILAMRDVVASKLQLFGSVGQG
jgi:tagatose 1,6-diphosphate aldolase GatY/KbaY